MFHKKCDYEQRKVPPTMHQAADKYFFLKDVDHRMTIVIEPVMKEISKELQSRGHGSAIIKEYQSISDTGNLRHRHISLIIITDNKRPAYNSKYSAIAFVANSNKKTVWVREKTIGSEGQRERNTGEYQVGEITRQLVEKHIRNFLLEALENTGS